MYIIYIIFYNSSSKIVLPLQTATYIANKTSSNNCFIPKVVYIAILKTWDLEVKFRWRANRNHATRVTYLWIWELIT